MFVNPCLFPEFKRLSNLNVFYPEMFSQFEKAVMTSTAKADIIVKAKFGDLKKKLKLTSFVYIRNCFILLFITKHVSLFHDITSKTKFG
jgi:hypothetical protein